MTRKDYIMIARALKHAIDLYPISDLWQVAIDHAALAIATALQEDNPRFDREFFLQVVRGEKDLHARPPRRP